MTYTHITQAEHHQIEILRKAKHKQSDIAMLLGRDKSASVAIFAATKASVAIAPNRQIYSHRPASKSVQTGLV
jgi:hypothetical protein